MKPTNETYPTGTIPLALFALVLCPSADWAADAGVPHAPPLAVAPFDATQARAHQNSWSDYLGLPAQRTNTLGMKFVLVPPGEFMMGNSRTSDEDADAFRPYGGFWGVGLASEYPRHRARLTQPLYLGMHEVTVGQFRRFVSDTGYQTDAEKDPDRGAFGWDPVRKDVCFNAECSWRKVGFDQTDDHPVVCVSWNDAAEFCKWLSHKEGKLYRLPTEAEWEYACRAGTTTRYASGDDPESLAQAANVADATLRAKVPELVPTIAASDGYLFTAPVGRFRPNAFGLYDMHGNAWEWCADWYAADYYSWADATDPRGPGVGTERVIRGGSWVVAPSTVRSSYRSSRDPAKRLAGQGFRIAMSLNAPAAAAPTAAKGQAEWASAILARIRAYHAGAPKNNETLRVIYFHPADVEPAADYRQRLTRIMLDIQDFYQTEMRRNGFEESRLPLEMEGKRLKIHMVQGHEPADAYTYENCKNGKLGKLGNELRKTLSAEFDLDASFAIVLCNLYQKYGDGSYRFHSPYYGEGMGDTRGGLSYAADCDLLDPLLLADTTKHILYGDNRGKFDETLANFNTDHLGGIAHELGHALSLPHACQTPSEAERVGGSLMGRGCYSYRRERWSPNLRGSSLTFASALRLAAHPLFTQSDRGRKTIAELCVPELRFTSIAQRLSAEGKAQSKIGLLAVIAYSDPDGNADYDATDWVAPVNDGAFSLTVPEHQPGHYVLRLSFLHLNGAVSTVRLAYHADPLGHPGADELNNAWQSRRAGQTP